MLLLSSAEIFQNNFFQKILSGILSGCQTVLIQIRTDTLGPNHLQRFSADVLKLPPATKELTISGPMEFFIKF